MAKRRAGSLALLIASLTLGCNNGAEIQEGSGGTTEGGSKSGGAPGAGGRSGSGGISSSGGTSSLGGAVVSGGTPSSGGVVFSGGALATGGSGSGGVSGSGGSSSMGGATGSGGSISSGGASGRGGSTGLGGQTGRGGAATGGSTTVGTGTGGSTTGACTVGSPLSGGTQHCSSNATGNVGSFSYSIWSSGSGGCITPYGVGAAYKATWNNAGDFLAGCGFQWNETQTYDQYGTISADYAYTKTGTAGGYSYIGIYGWSNNPLIEFYVVDDWFGTSPPTGGGSLKGTFTVDGGTYKVYTHQQVNQPSIHGTTTFMQYFSVRQAARQCGHISLTDHFKEWASLGLNLGKMASARLLTEAGGGSGSVDYSSATLTAK